MSQTFIKIMSSQNVADDAHSKDYKLLTVEGDAIIEFTNSPRPLVYVNGEEHLVTGNAYVMSESGKTISTFTPNDIKDQPEGPSTEPVPLTLATAKVFPIQSNRWLVATDTNTYIADSFTVDGNVFTPNDIVDSFENKLALAGSLTENKANRQLDLLFGTNGSITLQGEIDLGYAGLEILTQTEVGLVFGNRIEGQCSNGPFAATAMTGSDLQLNNSSPLYIPDVYAYAYLDTNFNQVIAVMDYNRQPNERMFGFMEFFA